MDYWGVGGGPKGMLPPLLKLLGGPGPPWHPLFLCLCEYWFLKVPSYVKKYNLGTFSIFLYKDQNLTLKYKYYEMNFDFVDCIHYFLNQWLMKTKQDSYYVDFTKSISSAEYSTYVPLFQYLRHSRNLLRVN